VLIQPIGFNDKMPLINVGNICGYCKGDGCGQMRGEPGETGVKMALLQTFFTDEPLSRNLSRNLNRKNAKP